MNGPQLTTREVMQSDPVIVPPDCPVAEVMRVMNRDRIGAVLVTEGMRLLGVFTERDLLRGVATALPGWREYPISHWMTRDPYTIGPDIGWDDAVGMMQRLGVRHLPVVEDGRVLGLLSTHALMARRTEYLDATVAQRMSELRRANDQLLARDAETMYNLRAAGRLQTKLLLPHAPPDWPGLDWAVHYAPLVHLGGDYYDFATPDPNHLGFLIADASGHSIPAAMVAIMTRTAFTEVANTTSRPGAVLTAINQRLSGLTDERFVTAFYGVLDRTTHTLRYAAAGHPYPMHVRARQGVVRPLTASGFLLGVMPDEVYTEREVQLEPGDRVVFYTDGLIEARNEIGEMYGIDRLTACLKGHGAEPAADLLTSVTECQKAFCGSQSLTDDVTIVVMAVG
jgi:sigma-B regulation protein RsbU (phosphoserine phosphatase)